MGILNKLFGYRWSLYVVEGGQLRYAMHEDSVLRMVGFVMGSYADGGRPVSPWSLHLNFNKAHQSFKLGPEHFTPDGENVTDVLTQAIERIDPGWRIQGAMPVFEKVPSKRRIKVMDPLEDYTDPDKMHARVQALLSDEPREETFFDIMDRVFGRTE